MLTQKNILTVFVLFLISFKGIAQETPIDFPVIFAVSPISFNQDLPGDDSEDSGYHQGDSVRYYFRFYIDDSETVDHLVFSLGTEEANYNSYNKSISLEDFHQDSHDFFRKDDLIIHASDTLPYQGDIYYQISLFNENGTCTYQCNGLYTDE